MSHIPHACKLARTQVVAGGYFTAGRKAGQNFRGKDYTGATQSAMGNGKPAQCKAAGAGLVACSPSAKLNRFSI
jgi:hypothetical protein